MKVVVGVYVCMRVCDELAPDYLHATPPHIAMVYLPKIVPLYFVSRFVTCMFGFALSHLSLFRLYEWLNNCITVFLQFS